MKNVLSALLLSTGATALVAQDCSNLGISLGQGDETVFAIQPIGFPFPIGGQTYADVHVTTNGQMYLSNAGLPAPGLADYTATTAEFVAGAPRVAPMWNDLVVSAADGGDVLIDNASGTVCTVTWKNAKYYGAPAGALFTVQAKLYPSGDVEFLYGPDVINAQSVATWANCIVGVTPGQGATLPAASDLSGGGVSGDVTLFEQFAQGTFDLASNSLYLAASSPGYGFVPNGPQSNCASVARYGSGCVELPAAIHEFFPAGAFDLSAGATVTLLRQPGGYVAIDGLPGAFVAPGASAYHVAAGQLDGQETLALSQPMPIVGGSTSSIAVTTKALIGLSGAAFPAIDYTPSSAEFVAHTAPVLAALWNDYDQTGATGGQILFEEIGGVAYLTWNGVSTWNQASAAPDTFQVQLDLASGDIKIVYQSVGGAGYSYLVGYTAGDTSFSPAMVDLSSALAAAPTVRDVAVAPLALDADLPLLGGAWTLSTSNIDPVSPISITFLGDAQVGLPGGLPLSAIGIASPGCFLHINTLLADLTGISVGGQSAVVLSIPSNASLAGAVLTAQSLGLSSQTPSSIVTSNAVEGRVGY